MGEANNRAEEIAALKAQEEAQAKAEAEFKKLVESPLTKEEAEKKLADNDIQVAQLRVIRLRKLEELNQIDHQIEMANLDRSIVVRRTMNKVSGMGEPVGGAEA